MSESKAEKTILKSYVHYEDLDTLLEREDIIVETTMNAINRENEYNKDYTLKYLDSNILVREDKFILEVLIEKINN